MWHQRFVNISGREFHDLTADKKLIILYPQVHYRNLFLMFFLEQHHSTLLYYRLSDDLMSLTSMFNELVGEIIKTAPELEAVILSHDTSPESCAKALATGLNDISRDQRVILYLDEFDRLDFGQKEVEFFQTLLNQLESSCSLVINARNIAQETWIDFVLHGEATIIGTQQRNTELSFSVNEEDRPNLEVYAFGQGRALVNGRQIHSWDGVLPRNLFFYFVDHDLVARAEIFQNFWPDLKNKEATNVFHVTKRKVTECISSYMSNDTEIELTLYSNGFYRPNPQIVRHYDVEEFESLIDKATMTFQDDEQAELYSRAVQLYRMPFLCELELDWVIERREKLQRLFIEALTGLARVNKAKEQYDEALSYFFRILREAPNREDIHREVMILYHQLGHPEEVVKQYQFLAEFLQDTLKVEPAPETRELFDRLRTE